MSEVMDNFALNVRARSRVSFEHAMFLAFNASPGGKASHWCEHPCFGLVLFWASNKGEKFHEKPIIPFPYELGVLKATDFVWGWLTKTYRSKFELKGWDALYDNGNVECEEAWRVYVEDWGHIGGSSYAIAAILPVWAWIGK